MKRNWKLWLALLATALWLVFIYSRSAKPAASSNEESVRVLGLLERLFPALQGEAAALAHRLVRKLAHLTEYLILGGLLRIDWRLLGWRSVLPPLLTGLAAAAADELLQTFVPGRSGQIWDVLLDAGGVALGIGLTLLFEERRWRGKEKSCRGS